MISVEGEPGQYRVMLKQHPNWVDADRCVGCGACSDVCPVEIADDFNAGLTQRKAIYLPVPHAIPNPFVIDFAVCTRCGACVEVCPTGAIKLPEQEREGFRILVVDDELVVRDSLKEWLVEKDFQWTCRSARKHWISFPGKHINSCRWISRMPGIFPFNRFILLLFFATVGVGLAACPHPKEDRAKSNTRLDLAKDLLAKGDLDGAASEANKSIAFSPTNDEAYAVRGLVEVLRAASVRLLLEVNGCLTGVDAEALRGELDVHLEKASLDFEKATRLAPDYGEAWSNRGVVANVQGDHETAMKYFEEALLHPDRLISPSLTRAHLGWAHFQTGDMVRAAKELLQAIQFQPGMCVATYRLGRVYFEREEWEKAAEQFRAVSDQPACGSQEASLYLMKVSIAQGLIDDAQRARDACLLMTPASCIAAQCRTEMP